jgi:hypothetical protein
VNVSPFFYLPAIPNHCLFQGRTGLVGRHQESVNKLPGLLSIKLNLIALIDDLLGHVTHVRNYEFGHRAPLNRGRLLEQRFIRRRDTGDKSLTLLLFCHRRHKQNVCFVGTHRKR